MIIAQIKIRGARASVDWRKAITAGMIGAQVQMDYNDEIWDSLHKTVVFRGAVTKDVITDAEVVTIPAEVVAKYGVMLRVGVYGVDADGNLAIPTIWADLGIVRDAADPSGDTTTDSSLPVWAQIQAMIGNLDDLNTTAKNNLVAAVNEALTEGGCTVDEDDVRRIVEDYLAANPPTVTESDPTVPAWAKQPTKPTYTASEVGALPNTYTPPNQTAPILPGRLRPLCPSIIRTKLPTMTSALRCRSWPTASMRRWTVMIPRWIRCPRWWHTSSPTNH